MANKDAVGNLTANFNAKYDGYIKGTQKVIKSNKRVSSSTRMMREQLLAHQKASRRSTQVMLEGSRAFEDAASVYGTMGFAGALRASANNISQMLFLISPAAGIIGGFVSAGLSTAPMLYQMAMGADNTKEKLAQLNGQMQEFVSTAGKMKGVELSIAEGGRKEGLRQQKEIRRQIAIKEAEQKAANLQVGMRKRELNGARGGSSRSMRKEAYDKAVEIQRGINGDLRALREQLHRVELATPGRPKGSGMKPLGYWGQHEVDRLASLSSKTSLQMLSPYEQQMKKENERHEKALQERMKYARYYKEGHRAQAFLNESVKKEAELHERNVAKINKQEKERLAAEKRLSEQIQQAADKAAGQARLDLLTPEKRRLRQLDEEYDQRMKTIEAAKQSANPERLRQLEADEKTVASAYQSKLAQLKTVGTERILSGAIERGSLQDFQVRYAGVAKRVADNAAKQTAKNTKDANKHLSSIDKSLKSGANISIRMQS